MRIANARLVNLTDGSAAEPADLWVADGRLSRRPGDASEPVLDLAGRFVLPGLWDAHVHMTQWALTLRRLDLSGARSTADVLAALGDELATRPDWATDPVVAGGVRATRWPDSPTGDQLDALSDSVAIAVLSGDLHGTWANRAALDRFGMSHLASGLLVEADAFALQQAINDALTSRSPADVDEWVADAGRAASARGVVGIVDMEMADNLEAWSRRMDTGFDLLRVRAATYRDLLDERIAAGLGTGDVVGGHPLLQQGPLKVITDGSITARTAWCRDPYGSEGTTGRCNVPPDELVPLMRRAAAHGLTCAIHAIGDAAMDEALEAFADTGAHGSIEHAQLATAEQAGTMASLGVVASVQPSHLVDDRDVCEALWPSRPVLPFGTLREAGVRLAFGSDAPVSPLNPWDAVERAVTRTGDDRAAWHPQERLDVGAALQASTGGICRLVPGMAADLIAVDENPFAVDPSRLHTFGAAMTMVGGAVVHSHL